MSNETNNQIEEVVKPYSIYISISSDYMSAKIDIDMNDNTAKIKKSDIMDALEQKNVVFGVHTHIIDEIVDASESVSNLEIAKGIPIQNGENGKIEYNFDTSRDIKPTINEDGSVDFKNTNFVIPVKKGDVLATRTMPTEGKDGTLVTGKIMKARDGKVVNFKIGKNVETSEDGLKAIASVDGSVKFEGDTVSVKHSLEISGDVGIKTGNIEFAGEVLITGNVTSGYSVVATEDIVIYGIVEAAHIETKRNLTINSGVQGNEQATIKVGKDFTSKFINGAKVECGGEILTDAIMHSEVNCESIIKAEGKKGIIIGGNIYAKEEIQAKCIGSKMGTTTFVSVGLVPEMLKDFQDLQDEKAKIEVDIQKVDKVLELIKKQSQGEMSAENKVVYNRSENLKKEHQDNLFKIKLRIDQLSKEIKKSKSACVKAGDIYQGVRIKVDNSFFSVKERVLQAKFYKEKNEIVMGSWDDM